MLIRKLLCLTAFFACVFPSLASANSGSLPITGWASEGYSQTIGNFSITGPSMSLFQGFPDGPDFLPISCTVGSVCNFSFTLTASPAAFCPYCAGYDFGSFRNMTSQWFVTDLTFTGSAFWDGSRFVTVPLNVSGTILAYQLINCGATGDLTCTLGPEEFSLNIDGTGSGQYDMQGPALGSNVGVVGGVYAPFQGDANVTSVPEPDSLTLIGSTGLLWFWIRRLVVRK